MRKLLPYIALVAFGLIGGWILYPIMQVLFSLERLLTHF